MNTITSTQLETLREDFLQSLIDNMSVQDLREYVYQDLDVVYSEHTLNELKNEIEDNLGNDKLHELLNKNSIAIKGLKWTLFYVIGSHMNNLPVNFLSELMNLPSNKLNTLTQSASKVKSNVINQSMNVYDSRLYSEVLKYYSERNEFFPS